MISIARRVLHSQKILRFYGKRLDVCIKIKYPFQYGGEESTLAMYVSHRALETPLFHNFVSFLVRRELYPKKILRFHSGDLIVALKSSILLSLEVRNLHPPCV